MVQSELTTVQRALVRFYQDTGFLPGTGPFRLDTGGTSYADGRIDPSVIPTFVATADRADWIEHPANLWPLVENPLRDPDGAGPLLPPHPLGVWSPTTRRGWSGPYLSLDSSILCLVPRVPSTWLAPGHEGRHAWAGVALLPAPVIAVADPFEGQPHDEPSLWSAISTPDGNLFAFTCFTRSFDPAHPFQSAFARHGMPFLLFDRNESPSDPIGLLRARLVSLGSDRVYGRTFNDPRFSNSDPAMNDPAIATDPSGDDFARFVHR